MTHRKAIIRCCNFGEVSTTSSALDETLRLWTTIVTRTFTSGQYDPQAEILAHRELTGSSVENSYLVLNNRYTIAFLGSKPTLLPKSVEKAFADWIWQGKKGIGYLEASLSHLPESLLTRRFDLWFTSLELISDFPSWRNFAEDVVDWLWAQKDKKGLWNCGRETKASHCFPLSESWRKKQNRKHDCSTRVLSLLRKYYS